MADWKAMTPSRPLSTFATLALVLFGFSSAVHAQGGTRFVLDFSTGISPSINGNVNSGAIGTLQGQAAAILPQSYGTVYGTGVEFRFGGGYVLDKESEVRAMF